VNSRTYPEHRHITETAPTTSLRKPRAEAALKTLEHLFLGALAAKHAEYLARWVRSNASTGPAVQDVHALWREHPLGDEWREFALEGLQKWFDMRCGHVYVVRFSAAAGSVKVGQTRQNPWARLKQLNHEAVVHPPALFDAVHTHDRWWLESCAHQALTLQGLHVAKEHFAVKPERALQLLTDLHAQDVQRFAALGLTQLTTPLTF